MSAMIYMLEDDSDDRYLTEEVVSELALDIRIEYFSSSTSLMEALENNVPALILADYNSSPENGLQLLEILKKSSDASAVPVVILTENNYPNLKKNCYAAGASSVISKPRDMVETRHRIRTFFEYWMKVAEVI